ncbi:hypothetical protein ACL02U_25715 [Streptomyces sp. MS06]|uniref:hypothetical protein n=1 Tax=Streptomyces sp. MS06 TaxID=3385974 RepID=UPI0039A3E80C
MSEPAPTVRIKVTDARTARTAPGQHALPAPGPEDISDRGLPLVAGLATRRGRHLRPGGPGKTVRAGCVFATPV